MADFVVSYEPDPSSSKRLNKSVSDALRNIGISLSTEAIGRIAKDISAIKPKVSLQIDKESIRKQVAGIKGIDIPIKINTTQLKELKALLGEVRSEAKSLGTDISATIGKIPRVSKGGGAGSTKAAVVSPSESTKNLNEVKNATDKATDSQKKLNKSIDDGGKNLASFGERVGFTTNRLLAYAIPATGIYQIFNSIRIAAKSIVEVDANINKLTQILNGNSKAANEVTDQILAFGAAYGVAGKDVLDIVNILAQAGAKFENVDQLVAATKALGQTKLAATFGDAKSTADGLVAVIGQFNLSVNDTTRILDIVDNLAKKFGSDASDIFEAAKRGGAAFSLAGGSFEEFGAVISAVRENTKQTAATIGTALNTIATRLQRTDIVDYVDELTKGIGGIRTASGGLIGPLQILTKVADATKGFRADEISRVVQTLTGERPNKVSLSIIKDLQSGSSVLKKALQESKNSSGALERDAQIGAQSLSAQLQAVATTFEKAFKEIGSNKELKDLIGTVFSLAKAFGKLIEESAPFLPFLIKLTALKAGFEVFKILQSGDIFRGFNRKQGINGALQSSGFASSTFGQDPSGSSIAGSQGFLPGKIRRNRFGNIVENSTGFDASGVSVKNTVDSIFRDLDFRSSRNRRFPTARNPYGSPSGDTSASAFQDESPIFGGRFLSNTTVSPGQFDRLKAREITRGFGGEINIKNALLQSEIKKAQDKAIKDSLSNNSFHDRVSQRASDIAALEYKKGGVNNVTSVTLGRARQDVINEIKNKAEVDTKKSFANQFGGRNLTTAEVLKFTQENQPKRVDDALKSLDRTFKRRGEQLNISGTAGISGSSGIPGSEINRITGPQIGRSSNPRQIQEVLGFRGIDDLDKQIRSLTRGLPDLVKSLHKMGATSEYVARAMEIQKNKINELNLRRKAATSNNASFSSVSDPSDFSDIDPIGSPSGNFNDSVFLANRAARRRKVLEGRRLQRLRGIGKVAGSAAALAAVGLIDVGGQALAGSFADDRQIGELDPREIEKTRKRNREIAIRNATVSGVQSGIGFGASTGAFIGFSAGGPFGALAGAGIGAGLGALGGGSVGRITGGLNATQIDNDQIFRGLATIDRTTKEGKVAVKQLSLAGARNVAGNLNTFGGAFSEFRQILNAGPRVDPNKIVSANREANIKESVDAQLDTEGGKQFQNYIRERVKQLASTGDNAGTGGAIAGARVKAVQEQIKEIQDEAKARGILISKADILSIAENRVNTSLENAAGGAEGFSESVKEAAKVAVQLNVFGDALVQAKESINKFAFDFSKVTDNINDTTDKNKFNLSGRQQSFGGLFGAGGVNVQPEQQAKLITKEFIDNIRNVGPDNRAETQAEGARILGNRASPHEANVLGDLGRLQVFTEGISKNLLGTVGGGIIGPTTKEKAGETAEKIAKAIFTKAPDFNTKEGNDALSRVKEEFLKQAKENPEAFAQNPEEFTKKVLESLNSGAEDKIFSRAKASLDALAQQIDSVNEGYKEYIDLQDKINAGLSQQNSIRLNIAKQGSGPSASTSEIIGNLSGLINASSFDPSALKSAGTSLASTRSNVLGRKDLFDDTGKIRNDLDDRQKLEANRLQQEINVKQSDYSRQLEKANEQLDLFNARIQESQKRIDSIFSTNQAFGKKSLSDANRTKIDLDTASSLIAPIFQKFGIKDEGDFGKLSKDKQKDFIDAFKGLTFNPIIQRSLDTAGEFGTAKIGGTTGAVLSKIGGFALGAAAAGQSGINLGDKELAKLFEDQKTDLEKAREIQNNQLGALHDINKSIIEIGRVFAKGLPEGLQGDANKRLDELDKENQPSAPKGINPFFVMDSKKRYDAFQASKGDDQLFKGNVFESSGSGLSEETGTKLATAFEHMATALEEAGANDQKLEISGNLQIDGSADVKPELRAGYAIILFADTLSKQMDRSDPGQNKIAEAISAASKLLEDQLKGKA